MGTAAQASKWCTWEKSPAQLSYTSASSSCWIQFSGFPFAPGEQTLQDLPSSLLHTGACETSPFDSQGSSSSTIDLRANLPGKHGDIPGYGSDSLSLPTPSPSSLCVEDKAAVSVTPWNKLVRKQLLWGHLTGVWHSVGVQSSPTGTEMPCPTGRALNKSI